MSIEVAFVCAKQNSKASNKSSRERLCGWNIHGLLFRWDVEDAFGTGSVIVLPLLTVGSWKVRIGYVPGEAMRLTFWLPINRPIPAPIEFMRRVNRFI